MTSWIKDACETRFEYQYTLHILTKYLTSSNIVNKYGTFFSISASGIPCMISVPHGPGIML